MRNPITAIWNRLMPPTNPVVQRRMSREVSVNDAEALEALGAPRPPHPPVGSEGPRCPLCNYHGLQKLNTGDVRCGRCGQQFPHDNITSSGAGQSSVQVQRVGFRDLNRSLYRRDVRRRW